MIRGFWEQKARNCIERIASIEALLFDVSVGRQMLELGRDADALNWLGSTGAMTELRRSFDAGFITLNERVTIESTINEVITALEEKDEKKNDEVLQAMKKVNELQDFLTLRTYLSFWRCMRQGIFR